MSALRTRETHDSLPVIVSSTRTPIGSFGGALRDVDVLDLGKLVIRESLIKAGVRPKILANSSVHKLQQVDKENTLASEEYNNWDERLKEVPVSHVVMGEVLQAGQGQNPARQSAIRAGIPTHVPSVTVNRVCGSGMEAITYAISQLEQSGGLIVAGGMESMSQAPYILPHTRWGRKMELTGKGELVDLMVHDGLYEHFYDYHMGMTAEVLADLYGISRREQDELGSESHRRAKQATEKGKFEKEIVPVISDNDKALQIDERPMNTSVEKMENLRPAFKKDGTVTAGNSAGISDGAAAMLLSTKQYAEENNLPAQASIVDFAVSALDPKFMGLAPVIAVKKLLKRNGLRLDDVDIIELHEAFAAQALACMKELNIPRYGENKKYNQDGSKWVNPHGSGISLGHPIGATGARIVVTLANELQEYDKDLGLATLCIGGGQGMAMLLKNEGL